MTACAASPTAAMSSSEMSIADPGKETRYFVIVRSCGCEFRNWVVRPNAQVQLQRIQIRVRAERAQSTAILWQLQRSSAAGAATPVRPYLSRLFATHQFKNSVAAGDNRTSARSPRRRPRLRLSEFARTTNVSCSDGTLMINVEASFRQRGESMLVER